MTTVPVLQLTQPGVDLICHSEGLRLKAYKCPAGVWTIGYGHTSASGGIQVIPGMVITREQALAILVDDIEQYAAAVRKLVKVRLTQAQFNALVSFVFNLGVTNFAKSTLLKLLNKGQYDAVPAQLARWVHSNGKVLPGLVKRRHAEAIMWSGVEQSILTSHDPATPVAQQLDAPKNPVSPHVTAGGAGAATVAATHSGWLSNLHFSPQLVDIAAIGLMAVGIFMIGAAVGWFISSRRKDATDGELLQSE